MRLERKTNNVYQTYMVSQQYAFYMFVLINQLKRTYLSLVLILKSWPK